MKHSKRDKARTVVTPDDILANHSDSVRALANAVRELVRREIPTSFERPQPGWGSIGFRDPQAGYFCGLFPKSDHLVLVFEHGASLPDPDGLFDAQDGHLKQVRFVTIHTLADVRLSALARMLHVAVQYGSVS